MAKEMNQKLLDKLVSVLKKDGQGQSETHYVNASGIERSQILRYLVKAEVIADPSLKIPATGPSIVKARESGLRWPRIAARAGISESAAKSLFEEKSGTSASDSYSGRGRKTFDGAGATSGRRGAGKKTAAAKTATSGRRGKAAGGAGSKKTQAAAPGRRGRRGTRSSAASDPK